MIVLLNYLARMNGSNARTKQSCNCNLQKKVHTSVNKYSPPLCYKFKQNSILALTTVIATYSGCCCSPMILAKLLISTACRLGNNYCSLSFFVSYSSAKPLISPW